MNSPAFTPALVPAARKRVLSARLEPFDSYWQAPADVEKGYASFLAYYRANYMPHLPQDRAAKILVISCGPGYLVNMLAHATKRGLRCEAAEAFPFLERSAGGYDVIVPEQELNHLTIAETIEFLQLCHRALKPGGRIVVYAMNGANPLVGSENVSHNIDHFYNATEHSLTQLMQLGGFTGIRPFALKLYVFWKNPLNYVGLAVTTVFELFFRIMFKLYGKNVKVVSKKIAAVAVKAG